MKNKILIFLSLLIVSVGVQAKLAGKNVVLVHGFNPIDLLERPADNLLQGRADDYWSEYWLSKAEANLYWASTDRITGGIKDDIQSQLQELAANGTCQAGCVFITHSTGDLVARYALSKLGQWGISSNDFKVLAVLDFAGAGGGTELADLAVSVTSGFGLVNSMQRAAINSFLGFDADAGLLGVLYDLRPATARSTATANNSIPRLRFVGAGSQYLGITKPFILGSDDAVVPMHSACGASSKSSYDSCSRSIKNNGVISYVSKAPRSLMYNHYAVLMGEGTNHSDAITNNRSGNFATVSNNTTKGVNVDFATTTSRKWWSWGKKVRWVKNGDRKSMSANVFDTLNN
jgi:hypothetical protein